MLGEICKSIKLIISDIDGVMTTGGIQHSPVGEAKTFDVQDGAGVKYLQRAGIETAVITGRSSQAVSNRCEELGITTLYQGALSKIEPFNEILLKKNLTPNKVAYIGDDYPDLLPLRSAGLSIAPRTALPEVKLVANYITSRAAGAGAYREMAMLIIKAQGKWDTIFERYRTS